MLEPCVSPCLRGLATRASVKTCPGKHEKGASLDERSAKEGFWLEEEFERAESLLRSFLVKGRDWGQPVFSHNKGARCPSVKAAWVTWRMWLASRDLSASWTGSDIRRCHRAVHANFHTLQTLLVQFRGLRWSGDVGNGGFGVELKSNARRERASGQGEFVNKIQKSLRHYASVQIFWLSWALFEGMEQEKAARIILLSRSSNQQSESYSTSARRFLNSGGGEDNCFCVLPVKFDYRRQIIAAITENVSGCELDLGSWQHIRHAEIFCGYSSGCLVSSEPVNVLPLNQTEQTQSPLCQRSVGKVQATHNSVQATHNSEGRIVPAFSNVKLPKASHLTASHFVCRCWQHQKVLESLLPGVTGRGVCVGQCLFRWGPGGSAQRAPLCPSAPAALHTAFPHPC